MRNHFSTIIIILSCFILLISNSQPFASILNAKRVTEVSIFNFLEDANNNPNYQYRIFFKVEGITDIFFVGYDSTLQNDKLILSVLLTAKNDPSKTISFSYHNNTSDYDHFVTGLTLDE